MGSRLGEWASTKVEKFLDIEKLSVDIADEVDGGWEVLYVCLVEQYFLYLLAYFFDGAWIDDFFFFDALDDFLYIHVI